MILHKIQIFALLAFALTFFTANAYSQQHNGSDHKRPDPLSPEWQERIKKEQIAFITSELDLTTEEAQQFWPVFNAVEKAKQAALKEAKDCYDALEALIAKKKAKDSELLAALDAYLQAKAKAAQEDINSVSLYKSVLPADKIVKLFSLQEKFRREMISRLGHPQQPGHDGRPCGPAPDGSMPGGPAPAGPAPAGPAAPMP